MASSTTPIPNLNRLGIGDLELGTWAGIDLKKRYNHHGSGADLKKNPTFGPDEIQATS
jgi:hypothetical protein